MVFPILLALFFALDQCSKHYGNRQVRDWLEEHRKGGGVYQKFPLFFVDARGQMGSATTVVTKEKYYIWLLGPVFELPFGHTYVDTIDKQNTVNEILHRRLTGKPPENNDP